MNGKYKYFLIEAVELLADLTRGLLDLEKNPDDKSMVEQILRTLHTLKGAAGVIGLSITSGIAHAMESCLIRFRDQDETIASEHITLLLEAATQLEDCIVHVKQGRDDKDVSSRDIILKLTGKKDSSTESDAFSPLEKKIDIPSVTEEASRLEETPKLKETRDPDHLSNKPGAGIQDETIRIKTTILDKMTKLSNEILINNIWLKNTTAPFGNLVKKWEHLVMESETGQDGSLAVRVQQVHEEIEQSLGLLEKKVSDTAALSREISHLIKETHMVPVKNLVFMYEKLVRDMSLEINKKIKFEIKGSDINLGRSLLDQIKEPICHLLRNSAIHGLERSQKRIDQGKPQNGIIRLEFVKEMGQVHIICYDDGKGLDATAIKTRSVEKGLITKETSAGLSDEDAYYLILRSGYSSAKIVTELAGRGVGLDVVKSCVSGIGGSISIESEKNSFCRMILTLPLSIDLISVFGIKIMGQYYLFPFRSIVETRLIHEKKILFETGKPIVKYNNTPIPLIRLTDILDIPGVEKHSQYLNIILVKGNFETIALIVDKLVGQMEIMPRKLEGRLEQIPNLLSSTILANGYPAFVLDVAGIIEKSKTVVMSTLKDEAEHVQPDILVIDDSMTTSMLIEGMLSSNGYTVSLAQNGEDALTQLSKKDFDLFVTDIQMPGMNGFELSKKIRQLHQYKDAPIVILSSRGSDAELRRGVEVGANAYIVKGTFDEEEFLSTIRSLIV